jgi:hypothetical protein
MFRLAQVPPPVWIAALFILIIIGLALYGYFTGAWEAPPDTA